MQRALRTVAGAWLAALVAVTLVACPLCPSVLLATAVADAHTGARATRPEVPTVVVEAAVWQDPTTDEEVVLAPIAALVPFAASVRAAPDAPLPLVDLSNFSRIGQVAPGTALPTPIDLVVVMAPPPLAAAPTDTHSTPAPRAPDDAPPPPLRGPPARA